MRKQQTHQNLEGLNQKLSVNHSELCRLVEKKGPTTKGMIIYQRVKKGKRDTTIMMLFLPQCEEMFLIATNPAANLIHCLESVLRIATVVECFQHQKW